MIHLFIDANIYLDFYRYTKDDLEELKKLIVLMDERRLTLYIPTIVIHEVWRKREKTLSNSLKPIIEKHNKFKLSLPHFIRSDYGNLVEGYYSALKQLSQIFNQLLEKVKEDIANKSLSADEIIKEIFGKGQVLDTDDFDSEIYQRAKFRIETGQPPAGAGKSKRIDDCLIWESLLGGVPDNEDLYFITQDSDFKSNFSENAFNEFLSDEWRKKKESEIIFYPNLSSFFKDHFPHIKFAEELRKEVLISKLASSSSFKETHEIISKLQQYQEFTKDQRNRIVNAVISNNQIYWIIDDADIKDFVTSVVVGHKLEIEDESLEKIYQLLPDLEIPF